MQKGWDLYDHADNFKSALKPVNDSFCVATNFLICYSLSISNSPADVNLVEEEAERIIAALDSDLMPMVFLENHQV